MDQMNGTHSAKSGSVLRGISNVTITNASKTNLSVIHTQIVLTNQKNIWTALIGHVHRAFLNVMMDNA